MISLLFAYALSFAQPSQASEGALSSVFRAPKVKLESVEKVDGTWHVSLPAGDIEGPIEVSGPVVIQGHRLGTTVIATSNKPVVRVLGSKVSNAKQRLVEIRRLTISGASAGPALDIQGATAELADITIEKSKVDGGVLRIWGGGSVRLRRLKVVGCHGSMLAAGTLINLPSGGNVRIESLTIDGSKADSMLRVGPGGSATIGTLTLKDSHFNDFAHVVGHRSLWIRKLLADRLPDRVVDESMIHLECGPSGGPGCPGRTCLEGYSGRWPNPAPAWLSRSSCGSPDRVAAP